MRTGVYSLIDAVSQMVVERRAERRAERAAAERAAAERAAAAPPPPPKRRAPDGRLYTEWEFVDYFGGHDEWRAAAATEQRLPEQRLPEQRLPEQPLLRAGDAAPLPDLPTPPPPPLQLAALPSLAAHRRVPRPPRLMPASVVARESRRRCCSRCGAASTCAPTACGPPCGREARDSREAAERQPRGAER